MITKDETGEVTIQAGNVLLRINPNPATQDELDRIAAFNPDNAEELIEWEIKCRTIHAKFIELDELELIEQMIESDPSGWFITYCNSRNIIF